MQDLQKLIEEIRQDTRHLLGTGKAADYIPALARVNPDQYGIAIAVNDGQVYQTGDAETPFSIQSISKVLLFALVYRHLGETLWQRVGREPSGNPFNSLVQLEREQGIPRNPMINAGALVITDMLLSQTDDALKMIRDWFRLLAGNEHIDYDQEIARSERETGYRNAALVNFMKSFGNIHNPVDQVLDVYCHHCSISMSTVDLARAFLFLSAGGRHPLNDREILTESQTKRMNALMQSCGFYDQSGEFTYSVGLPGKSGVGGGILAVVPGQMTICVWSPELNRFGNSVIGMRALEEFTTRTGFSLF